MTIVHDFQEQLRWSEAAGYEPFWDAVYRKAFPNMVNHMICSGNTQSQRMGVDRIVYLGNDKEIRIDEKKRKEVWNDVLLEYISVDTTGAPGWMEKDLVIDFLAYAFIPSKQCYLYPWPLLRRVWLRYKDEWIYNGEQGMDGFRKVPGKNKNYTTWSVAVPRHVLHRALRNSLIIDVSAELSGWQPPEKKAKTPFVSERAILQRPDLHREPDGDLLWA